METDTNIYKKELERITKIFLTPEDNYGDLFNAAEAMYKLLVSITEINQEDEADRKDIYLPDGKAIGPIWAAMCVKEFMRTKRFISGIFKAANEAKKRFPNTRLHILYAGTGPFATLVLPLTAFYASSEISFTLLEINEQSIKYLEKVIKTFEIQEYIKSIVCCDATKYKIDSNVPVHIIISETMLNALQKEPQAAITLNLAPQLIEDGIFIPQNITVEAGLFNPSKHIEKSINPDLPEPCYHILDSLFELNKDTYKSAPDYNNGLSEYMFKSKEVILSNADNGVDYPQLCLFTTIQVFDDEYLSHWQSSLNMPKKVADLNKDKPINKVEFKYVISSSPKFEYSLS